MLTVEILRIRTNPLFTSEVFYNEESIAEKRLELQAGNV